MKVKNILFAVAALVGLTLFASSCKEDDGPQFRMIVDKWTKVSAGHFFEDLWW